MYQYLKKKVPISERELSRNKTVFSIVFESSPSRLYNSYASLEGRSNILLWSYSIRSIRPKLGGAIMKKYEIMYILNSVLEEQARKDEIAKLQGILEANKVKVTNSQELGMKDFATPIKKQLKGYYVVLKVSGEIAGLNEWSRQAKLDQNVLRFLITIDQD